MLIPTDVTPATGGKYEKTVCVPRRLLRAGADHHAYGGAFHGRNPDSERPATGIVTIAAFTANGDLEKLKPALHDGLEAGLTVNDQGSPCAIVRLHGAFRAVSTASAFSWSVLDERKARGIRDEEGREPSPLPANWTGRLRARVRAELAGWKSIPAPSGYQLFTPAIDAFLKQHLFADILPATIWTIRAGNWRPSQPWPPCRALARSCASISARP